MDQIVADLAPTGMLRAGINLSNFLLVTGRTAGGDPVGVAPDMAGAIAERLGVPLGLVPFASPGELADAAGRGRWDIGLIADEPARAKVMAFTPPYVEIEATYLVRADAAAGTPAEVDRAGVRIAVPARTAYELWLTRNIKEAEIVRTEGAAAALAALRDGAADALAGLKPGLIADAAKVPGARLLAGRFTAVQQAIGTGRANAAGLAFLAAFVAEAKRSGLIARLIDKHGVAGRLAVAAD